MDFSLDIKTASPLEDAIQGFFEPESLEEDNAFHCLRCQSYTRAEKTIGIGKLPTILTIQLKRDLISLPKK